MLRISAAVSLALGISALAAERPRLDLSPKPARTAWPLFGGTLARNMVNLTDKNIATDWCVQQGKERNIKWAAELGTKTYGGPIVAGGRVFVGTNNGIPRDPGIKAGHFSVVMCFRESDGKFLWQAVHEIPDENAFTEVRFDGLRSAPTIDGHRLYYVLPQAIVVCADAANGKVLWQYDMRKELQVAPFQTWLSVGDCSPLVIGDVVYLVTANGINGVNGVLPQPLAPSFVALHKYTGKLAWQSNLPGARVMEGQWSNPAYAVIQGKPQVIFGGGDGSIYGFEPASGKLIWEFHTYPKNRLRNLNTIDNYIVATPVIHDGKVFVGLGVKPENAQTPRHSWFVCIDATRQGDVSPVGGIEAQVAQNMNGALLWKYGGLAALAKNKERLVNFKTTVSTCAIHDGLVYIPEESGYMHCLDARTGQKYWMYDFMTSISGSPLYVDGKVYIGTEDGEVVIFEAGKKPKVINKIDMDEPTRSTPVAANGVLFVATSGHLYAIAEKKP